MTVKTSHNPQSPAMIVPEEDGREPRSGASKGPKPLKPKGVKNALLAAGFELLAERPAASLKIDHVVSRAGVARGSFYYHFDSIEALVSHIVGELHLEVHGAGLSALAHHPGTAGRLIRPACAVLKFCWENRQKARVFINAVEYTNLVNDPIGNAVDFAVKPTEEQMPDADVANANMLVMIGSMYALILRICHDDMEKSELMTLGTHVYTTLLAGFGMPRSEAAHAAQHEVNLVFNTV